MCRRGEARVAASGSIAGPRTAISCSYRIDRQMKQIEYPHKQERAAPHRDTSADTALHTHTQDPSVASLLLLTSALPTDRASQTRHMELSLGADS